MKVKAREYKYVMIFVVMLLCYYMYSISKIYGFELLPDEFGYWNYAAFLSGYDWSNIVSLGSYYSFGYTLILYPILKFIENPVLAYRVAVSVNFLLLFLSYFLLMRLTKKLCKDEKYLPQLFTAIAVLYPSWIFFARITMSEIVIMTMYILICDFMYDYLEKNRAITLVFLVIALIYIYTVHMRTVGILIAAGMTILLHCIKNAGKHSWKYILILLGGIGLFLGVTCIKKYVSKEIYIYGSEDSLAVNDYSGQMHKLKNIFSLQGFTRLCISFAGKIFYLGLATFGLFYAGIVHCIRKITTDKNAFCFFVLLATLGEIAITSIYCGVGGYRIDGLTYGRYNEQILPILLVLGGMALWEAKKIWRYMFAVILLQIPMFAIVLYQTQKYYQDGINPWMILGISYGYNRENFEPLSFYLFAFVIGIVGTVFVWSIFNFAKKKKNIYLFLFIMALELLLALRLQMCLADAPQLGNYRDTKLIEEILDEKPLHPRTVYLHIGESTAGQRLQFGLQKETVEVESQVDQLLPEDLVITADDSPEIDKLKEMYKNWRIMGHLSMFYN